MLARRGRRRRPAIERARRARPALRRPVARADACRSSELDPARDRRGASTPSTTGSSATRRRSMPVEVLAVPRRRALGLDARSPALGELVDAAADAEAARASASGRCGRPPSAWLRDDAGLRRAARSAPAPTLDGPRDRRAREHDDRRARRLRAARRPPTARSCSRRRARRASAAPRHRRARWPRRDCAAASSAPGAIGRGIVASLARAGFPVSVYDVDARAPRPSGAAGGDAAASLGALAGRARTSSCWSLPDTPRDRRRARGGLERRLRRRHRRHRHQHRLARRRRSSSGAGSRRAASTCSTARSAAGPSRRARGRARDHGRRRRGRLRAHAARVLEAIGVERRPRRPARPRRDREARQQPDGRRDRRSGSRRGSRSRPRPAPTSQRVCEAIAGGSGSSWILREWIPETVFAGDYARRFSLDLMLKDMGLIAALAGRLGVPAPALEVAAAAFERAVADGLRRRRLQPSIQLHARGAPTRGRSAGAELVCTCSM